MGIKPLGWELTTVLVVAVALVAALAFEVWTLVPALLFVLAVLTPFIFVSAATRLVVGILDENRRHRSSKALRREL